jgi:hypothetical protein
VTSEENNPLDAPRPRGPASKHRHGSMMLVKCVSGAAIWCVQGHGGLRGTARLSICLRCLRSLECHAANDESLCLLPEDRRLALLGLVKTVELADPRIVFDGSKSIVGQSNGISLDVLEQVFGERLLWALEDLDSNNRCSCVLDAETAERLGDLWTES